MPPPPDLRQRFEALLSAHGRIVVHVARLYANDAHDRQDLAQEIRVQMWRAFPAWDASRPFTTWAYRVALNVGISHLRQAGQRARHFAPWDDGLLETVADARPGPGDEDPLRALAALVADLAPLDRALILLYLDDRPQAEIADVLGISETNVATKINRIKQRWRRDATASSPASASPADAARRHTEGDPHGTR